MDYNEERKKKRRTPYIVYTLLLAAALVTAVSTIAQASNFINTDGYINLSSSCTNLTNGTCTINYNTTRYANSTLDGILSASDWNRFNSSTSSNYSDGNNYTTSIAFERSSNNIILQNARNGISSNVSAFFTLQSSTGILTTNGITYANATNCTSGQYSRYEDNGWNCYNDASGGSGTVTSITINSTTPSVSVVNPTVTTAGTVVIDIANATVFSDGLMTSVQATSLALKALAGNCVGYNSTHVNVTMNSTTAGVECVAVSLNPGGSSFDPAGLYSNITDLQNSNSSTNTRVNSVNTTTQNLLSSNTTLFGLILQLGQNDTNLNNSINAVNNRATTINNTLVTIQQNITDLQNSNTSTNTRINTVNTTVQNLLSSNTSINTRADSINNSITTLSTFAQTKAATGYSGDCPTGIAGFTINNGTAPNKTCAPAQSSGGSGMTEFGISSGGTNRTMLNSSTFNLYGSGVSINVSGSGNNVGATITVSAGGGNVSGGSINGTLGFVSVWNSTTTITNSSMYINANTGDVTSYRYLAKAGSSSAPMYSKEGDTNSGFNIGAGGEAEFYDSGVRVLLCNADGCEIAGGNNVFPGVKIGSDEQGVYGDTDFIGVTVKGNSGGGQVANFTTEGVGIINNLSVDGVILNAKGYPYGDGTPEYWNPYTLEFTNCNANVLNPFLGAATSSGTIVVVAGTAEHPGICGLRDSTTANGNYRVMNDVNSFLINGTERGRFIFQYVGARPTQSARLGFQDSTAIQTQPVDGVYFNISGGGNLTGVARNNSVQATTASTYVITPSTWYNAVFEINSAATLVNFYLYDEDGITLLWSDTVSTRIPVITGRETGYGVIAGETSVDAAADILRMDFMNLQISRKIR